MIMNLYDCLLTEAINKLFNFFNVNGQKSLFQKKEKQSES